VKHTPFSIVQEFFGMNSLKALKCWPKSRQNAYVVFTRSTKKKLSFCLPDLTLIVWTNFTVKLSYHPTQRTQVTQWKNRHGFYPLRRLRQLRRALRLLLAYVFASMRVDLSLGLGGHTMAGQSTPTTVLLSFTSILPPTRNGVRSHSRYGTESWTELELAFRLTVTFLIRLQGPNDSLH